MEESKLNKTKRNTIAKSWFLRNKFDVTLMMSKKTQSTNKQKRFHQKIRMEFMPINLKLR
jgi:hypothetical protein